LVGKSQNTPIAVKELSDEEVKLQRHNKSCLVYSQIRVLNELNGGNNSCTKCYKRHGNTFQENSPHLEQLLAEYHDIFSLEEGERGGTDWIKFEIDTGNEPPRKQAVRRIPFAVRHEITNQLEKMQRNGGD